MILDELETSALLNRTRNLDEAAQDEPELMAPTSCLTLKWKNEEEEEDPGRSVSHIMCPRSTPVPDEKLGAVRQSRRVTSHSSFPGPAYL